MKNYIYIIFASFCIQCLCILEKKLLLKNQLQQDDEFEGYGKTILEEINQYRTKNMYDPQIIWLGSLAQQASLEASKIKANSDFGRHARFEEYNAKQKNNLFTEFSVIIPTEGTIPNQNAFAIMVLEAILKEERFHIMHQYTHGGIAIVKKNRKECLVVLHLIKQLGTYKSCKEAFDNGDTLDQIILKKKGGKKELITCDQKTAGGGWTLILDSNTKAYKQQLHLPINDRDLKIKQILFKAKDNFSLSWANRAPRVWKSNGFEFQLLQFKIGNFLYTEQRIPARLGNMRFYDKYNDVQLLRQATECYWGGSNQITRCAKDFIVNVNIEGKLTEITDYHTIHRQSVAADYLDLFFFLYVR